MNRSSKMMMFNSFQCEIMMMFNSYISEFLPEAIIICEVIRSDHVMVFHHLMEILKRDMSRLQRHDQQR